MHDIPPLIASVDTLKEIAELSSYNLRIPERAATKGQRHVSVTDSKGNVTQELNPKFTAAWTEKMEVVESKMLMSDHIQHKGEVECRIKFRVIDNENNGRPFSVRYFIAPDELPANRPNSDRRKMTYISCGRLNALLRAAGWGEIGGTDIDYREYFSGDKPTVIGAIVNASVRHYVNEGQEYQDVQDFKSPVT